MVVAKLRHFSASSRLHGMYLLHQPLLDYANQWLADIFSPASRFLVLLIGIGLLCYYTAVGLHRLVQRLRVTDCNPSHQAHMICN